MNLEGASIYDAPGSLERFKKMSETITLRGVETNDKANSSLLAVTRNMRPISLRSVSSKESRGSVPTRYTTSPMSDVATDAVAKGSVPSRYTSNPASYVVTNDDRDDITSCCTSTSMDQPYDDIFQKRPSMSTESFGTNPLKVIALQSSILSETPADLDLKRNDEAFESIADLIIDHLSPKVVDGSSHYFLSKENISHLEFLVPMSVRLRFVGALRYRATSLSTSSSNDDIPSSFLVRECTRLGLGRDVKDNILLGGGIKMTDGMTRVVRSNPPAPFLSVFKKKLLTSSFAPSFFLFVFYEKRWSEMLLPNFLQIIIPINLLYRLLRCRTPPAPLVILLPNLIQTITLITLSHDLLRTRTPPILHHHQT